MEWFKKIKTGLKPQKRKEIPDNLWIKCEQCGEILYRKQLRVNQMMCTACSFHFPITARQRVEITLDEDSFTETETSLTAANPLKFPDYESKIKKGQKATDLKDCLITGTGTIEGMPVALGVSDSNFMMGSMGSVVGEKFHRLAVTAIAMQAPLIFISAGGGGVRMQEGMVGLMQMAKTSAAVSRLHKAGILFVSVLTHPTMGGVLASYASLGDIIIAEPNALIGFAGPRVIKGTIGEELPEGFQTSEFQLEHGIIDMVVPRNRMREQLQAILAFYYAGKKIKKAKEPAAAAEAQDM